MECSDVVESSTSYSLIWDDSEYPDYPESHKRNFLQTNHPNSKPHSKADVATNSHDATTLAAVHTINQELQYEMGYGDFCFGSRIIDRQPEHNFSLEDLSEYAPKAGCSPQHIDPFPLFTLHPEIRRQIFHYLILPALSPKGNFPVHLDEQRPLYLSPDGIDGFPQDFDTYYSAKSYRAKHDPEAYKTERKDHLYLCGKVLQWATLTEAQRAHEIHRYEEKRQRYVRQYTPHPFRETYTIIAAPILKQDGKEVKMANGEMQVDVWFREWLRKASHVSRQFRKELGDAVWERSEITTAGYTEDFGMGQIGPILASRPAILKGIKELRLFLDYEEEDGTTIPLAKLPQLTTFLGHNLQLEILHLEFTVQECDMNDLAGFEGPFENLKGLREVVVTRKMEVTFHVLPDDEDLEENVDDMMCFRKAMEAKYLKRVRKLITPKRLCAKVPKTEKERYLEERKMIVGIKRKRSDAEDAA